MVLPRHEVEVDQHRDVWERKPLLRRAYERMYDRIGQVMVRDAKHPAVEIGSGIASLRSSLPDVVASDSFVRPWLDAALNAYDLPFRSQTVATLIAVDVFHHLSRPLAMLAEAHRVLIPEGQIILVEPYVSMTGWLAYGPFHDEPIAMRDPIDWSTDIPANGYYAAQGNATRIFFGDLENRWGQQWRLAHASRFSAFAYLFSGGFSRPALYPGRAAPLLEWADGLLSRWPTLFAARCLVVLQRK